MLCLARKVGEKIVIGEGRDQVILTIVEVKGQQIRLGFEAPRHVKIMRSELVMPQLTTSHVPPKQLQRG